MPISISGSGTITGASSFSSNTIFGGSVGVSGAVNTSSNLLVSGRANVAQGLSTASGGITQGSMPAGSVVQVLQVVKTDVFGTSSTSYTDVTGLSISITPSSTSNKIMVIGGISFGPSTTQAYAQFGRLMRNGSAIFIADAAGNRDRGTFSFQEGGFEGPLSLHFNYLDSPSSTSSVTYNIQIRVEAPQTAYINRGVENDGDSSLTPRAASSLTVMEIAG